MFHKTVLYVTAFHPGGRGVIGAGESVAEDSINTLLSEGRVVHVLALAPGNQEPTPAVVNRLRAYQTVRHTAFKATLGILQGVFIGSLVAPWFFTRACRENIEIIQAKIRELGIEEVWLDFPSTLGIGARLDSVRIVYFVHDVVTQKVKRRVLLGFMHPVVKRVEAKLLGFVKKCITLSDKDRALIQDIGFVGEVAIQSPANVRVGRVNDGRDIAEIVRLFSGKRNLVFFGSMQRAENHWSILWFLFFVYPKIKTVHHDVQFWIVGLAPRLLLRIVGPLIKDVHVVGAVDDPTSAFEAASLCVVPLRYGAGVKLKVLQMLNAGAVVISSAVGAEGIPESPNLFVVSPGDFANLVNQKLAALDVRP